MKVKYQKVKTFPGRSMAFLYFRFKMISPLVVSAFMLPQTEPLKNTANQIK